MSGLTPEQIIALAPDSSSAKAGRELASPRKWLVLGNSPQVIWGECQGSAKEPYQTQIDLSGPAFKCSCPSRKFPCKHGLGLYLLQVSQPGSFTQHEPPTWVIEWLTKRTQNTEKVVQTKGKKAQPQQDENQNTSTESNKRSAKREERVLKGLEDLELWLCDLVRQGMNSLQAQSQTFWDNPAARLVDAQAPGLARRIRRLASIPASGEGWQERLLAELGELSLLIEGYRRSDLLPEPARADIRAQIGWTQDQDEVLAQEGVRDCWLVVGKRVEEETLGKLGRSSFLKVQRTWLWGKATRKQALFLDFAAPGQVFNPGFIPGTFLETELAFFPGGYPMRALVKGNPSAPVTDSFIPGYANFSAAYQAYIAAFTAAPWLDIFPMTVQNVTPCQHGEKWGLRDADGFFIPIRAGFMQAWSLVSLSGGNPLTIFSEWDGTALWPLSVWADRRFILLQPINSEGGQHE